MPHVFLNPDETQSGLSVIIAAKTGVTYHQQCGGYATKQLSLEGFLIPLGGPVESKKIYDWFWATFQGYCSSSNIGTHWTPENTAQLEALVAEIPCWHTTSTGEDERHHLQLDLSRMSDCIEAWIPVLTPYGSGILTLENSD